MGNGNNQVVQIAVNSLPFWSRFIIPFDLRWNGVACLRQVITIGNEIRAFGYNQQAANAQQLMNGQATERDTIVQEGGKTRGGSRYIIVGMSLTVDGYPYDVPDDNENNGLDHYVWPASATQPCNEASGPLVNTVEDQRSLLSALVQAFTMAYKLDIKIDGTRRTLEMGVPQFYPGQGGTKDLIGASNGDTFVSNFMPIPETIVWNPSGAVDSQLTVALKAAYNIFMPTWVTPTGTANGLPVSETNPKITDAVPTPMGRKWRQAFILNFHGREESPVSNVS